VSADLDAAIGELREAWRPLRAKLEPELRTLGDSFLAALVALAKQTASDADGAEQCWSDVSDAKDAAEASASEARRSAEVAEAACDEAQQAASRAFRTAGELREAIEDGAVDAFVRELGRDELRALLARAAKGKAA
jgi:hypothetical protein